MGVNGEKTRVGDRFVYEKMLETGATLGGEPSGHIIFSRYATTGDGILTAIKLTEMAVENKCKFSLLFEGMESYPQAVVNVKVKNKTGALNSLAVAFAAADAEECLKEKGGRLLLRPSGTESVVRILTESEDEKLCRETAEYLKGVLERADRDFSEKEGGKK